MSADRAVMLARSALANAHRTEGGDVAGARKRLNEAKLMREIERVLEQGGLTDEARQDACSRLECA